MGCGGVGGGIATQPVHFNGKSTKMRFSCFSEQMLAKFFLNAIYFDENHAYVLPTPLAQPHRYTSQKWRKPLILMIFVIFDMTSVMTSQSCHTWDIGAYLVSMVRGNPELTPGVPNSWGLKV